MNTFLNPEVDLKFHSQTVANTFINPQAGSKFDLQTLANSFRNVQVALNWISALKFVI